MQLPWQEVPIVECRDPLLRLVSHGRLVSSPIYRQLGFSNAIPDIYLRSRVIERLRIAASALPGGFTIAIWDGWRPIGLQTQLYDTYRARLAVSTQLTGKKLDELVSKFVIAPSIDLTKPSPHLTGGAIDLTLADENGRPLEMGSRFDEMSERSALDHYAAATDEVGALFQQRRQLLSGAMASAGFVASRTEWWHFNYGDQIWAYVFGEPAVYGITSPAPVF